MTDLTVKQWAMILACISYVKQELRRQELIQTGKDLFTTRELEEIERILEETLKPWRGK